uniref:C-type lectin domain-containing protein n=1 Tax=Esox lucius TaxID=8010 RepID=A0AAY5KF54_ESOLU
MDTLWGREGEKCREGDYKCYETTHFSVNTEYWGNGQMRGTWWRWNIDTWWRWNIDTWWRWNIDTWWRWNIDTWWRWNIDTWWRWNIDTCWREIMTPFKCVCFKSEVILS